jgi:hypothetical protein
VEHSGEWRHHVSVIQKRRTVDQEAQRTNEKLALVRSVTEGRGQNR